MLVVLLALLGVLLAAGTLVSRANQGQLGSIFNGQTYGARKVAEAGISRLIGEWNLVSNRMLLASGSPAATWQASNQWLRNPCTATTTSLASATPIGGGDLAAYRTGAWIEEMSGDATRRYRLRRVTFRHANRQISTTVHTQPAFGTDITSVPAYPNMANNSTSEEVGRPFSLGDPSQSHGYLEVEVEGQLVRGTTVVASSRVVKEFQVVPKCCKRSFGRTLAAGDPPTFEIYGNDWRQCDPPSGLTPGKLPLLTGLNGGGLTTDNGNSWWLRVAGTSPPKTVDPIICTSAAITCDGPDGDTTADSSQVQIDSTDGKIGVTSFDIRIPDPPGIPPGDFIAGPNLLQKVNAGGALRVESITPNDDGIEDIISLPSQGLNKQGSTKFCGYREGAFHCRISSIRLPGNKIIEVDTSVAPVYLYLQDPPGDIDIKGTAGLRHLYNGAPAAVHLADRFQIRGAPRNSNPASQIIMLTGDSVNTSMFIWAPVSNLSLGGNAIYKGLLWVNNLGFYGNAQVTVPSPNGPDDTCPETLPDTAVYCRLFRSVFTNQIPLAFDWVARSETLTKFYGAPP